jgi:hypothetical protein
VQSSRGGHPTAARTVPEMVRMENMAEGCLLGSHLWECIGMGGNDCHIARLRTRVVEGDVLLDGESRPIGVAVGRCCGVLARVRAVDRVLDHAEGLRHFHWGRKESWQDRQIAG